MIIRLTPASASPARMVAATGAAPRWRGRSDGWTFSGWTRRGLEQAARHELAVGHQQEAVGPERVDRLACLGRAQRARGDERQSRGARRVGDGRSALAEAATGRAVGAADDEEVVSEVREAFEERDADRAAAQERDPAEH